MGNKQKAESRRPMTGEYVRFKSGRLRLPVFLCPAFVLTPVSGALVLEAGEVLVVVNAAVPGGVELASYYLKQRGIPGENIVQVWLPGDESIGRKQYDEKIAAPMRKVLKELERRRPIRCLLK